jgi:ATP-dependent DNA helicase RecG
MKSGETSGELSGRGSGRETGGAGKALLSLETRLVDLSGYRIPRVGRKTAENLAVEIAALNARPEAGEATVEDLLHYLPLRYEDRSNLTRIASLEDGIEASVELVVQVGGIIPLKGGRLKLYEFFASDGTDRIRAFWWNQIYLNRVFQRGTRLILYGQWRFNRYKGIFEIENPDHEILSDGDEDSEISAIHTARRVPIYRKLGEFRTRTLRSILHHVIEQLSVPLPDPLPAEMIARCGLPSRDEALRRIHFPSDDNAIADYNESRSAAHRRLIFEELFWLALALGLRRVERMKEPKGEVIEVSDRIREVVRGILPFSPTAAQKRALREIVGDLTGEQPMNRLLQGDVGSGKTIVAIQAMVVSIENGYQAALMVPTEILAEQHARNIKRILASRPYRVELLTGSLKAKEKRAIHEALKAGEIDLVVGTHALIQEGVDFSRLGLVVVDEQHRFGVMQRAGLRRRGFNPDVLVMTATPIPRSLAMTVYGDLDVSVIDELPPGRTAVRTHVRGDDRREKIYEFIRSQLASGRQAYVVYPIIEESEKLDLRNATDMYEDLRSEVFPEFRLGLLHGRMKPLQKEEVMRSFAGHDLDLLVATTVIEVGVDVPNASVMLIEHAERFGLSQLHQLRGRVGRGAAESYCILLARFGQQSQQDQQDQPGQPGQPRRYDREEGEQGPHRKTQDARERLKTMEETNDGFLIAEKDLEIRGPGEVMGTRQSGIPTFRLANLVRDQKLLELAKLEADHMLTRRGLTRETDLLIRHLQSQPRYGLSRIG